MQVRPAGHSLPTPGPEVHGQCPKNAVRDDKCQLQLFRRYTTVRPQHFVECVLPLPDGHLGSHDTHPTICKVAAAFRTCWKDITYAPHTATVYLWMLTGSVFCAHRNTKSAGALFSLVHLFNRLIFQHTLRRRCTTDTGEDA